LEKRIRKSTQTNLQQKNKTKKILISVSCEEEVEEEE
jgi:hypothetical protein